MIKSLGLWNEEEGVSEPAVVVLDKEGTVRRLYSGGTDISDRPPEEALEEVGASDGETPTGRSPTFAVLRRWQKAAACTSTPVCLEISGVE